MPGRLLAPALLASAGLLFGTFKGAPYAQAGLQNGSRQDTALQDLTKDLNDDEDGARRLFFIGDKAVPSLIKFLSGPDQEKRIAAARALAYIGNQEGDQALRTAAKTEQDNETKSAILSYLAGGMVGTTSESDLNFLKRSIQIAPLSDDGEPGMPAISAALALGMMARNDSLGLLRKIAKEDEIGSAEIAEALRWIENRRSAQHTGAGTPTNDDDRVKKILLNDTFFAEAKPGEVSISALTFNHKRDKVLVSLDMYRAPRERYGYDLVLAKKNGDWKVVGIWFAWIA